MTSWFAILGRLGPLTAVPSGDAPAIEPRGDGPTHRAPAPSQPSSVDATHRTVQKPTRSAIDTHRPTSPDSTRPSTKPPRRGSLRSAAQRIGASSSPSPRYGGANHTPRMWRESRGGPACLRPFVATSTSLHGPLRHPPSWAGPCRLPLRPNAPLLNPRRLRGVGCIHGWGLSLSPF